jgi:hypothetical protein
MRYAALVAASLAVVAVITLPRDGRGEAAPASRVSPSAVTPRPAQAAPARLARQAGTQEDFRWTGRVARGDEIEIRGLLGDVVAERASGDQVEVVGRRIGDDADRVRIEVVEGADGVVICAIYPTRPGRHDRDTRHRDSDDGPCDNGMHGELDVDDDEARIDFTVRVPAGVRFAARTVDGDIRAEDLRSDVDAATVSGNVRVATTGTARAATVSGDVDATFGQADGEGMEFASVSGNVIVRLAGNVGARVEAHTLSGDIRSDFEGVRVRPGGASEDEDDGDDDGGFHINIEIGKEASGTIGGGGPELSLNTVSGNIHLLRSR